MRKLDYKILMFHTVALIICGMILGICNRLNAQTIIEGEFDSSFKIDSFLIAYATDPVQENNIYAKGEEKTIQVSDGKFKIELAGLPTTFYILFRFPEVDYRLKSDRYRAFAGNPLLLKSHTKTNIQISPTGVSFQGENKAMLDCQFDLFLLQAERASLQSRTRKSYNFNDSENIEEKTWEFLNKIKDIYYQIESRGSELVKKSYNHIPKSIKNQILYDFIGSLRSSELMGLNFSSKEDSRINKYVVDFYMRNYIQNTDSTLISNYLGRSRVFASYLCLKITLDLSMATSRIEKKIGINLPLILDVAAKKYQGSVYDQIAFSAFLNMGISHDIDEGSYILLLSSIESAELRFYIKDDYDRKKSNPRSFQFRLVDESGKYLSNTDFKGKVVLFDFWFTGCSGCISLHEKMKPIKEYFKDRTDVVFVSICVDSKEELWRKSIKSGKYTDDKDVKLWVGPGKVSHSIVKHYNIASYPTMVLVDANDKLVMVNPPKPTNKKRGRELIFRIEQAMHEMKQ